MAKEGSSEVMCIVKTHNSNGMAHLCSILPSSSSSFSSSSPSLSPLLITPYHPIKVNNKWRFPKELEESKLIPCPAVFSVVLQSGHIMEVNGIQCVGLGHNFEEDEVVKHPFFGSSRVVEELKKCNGWKRGLVEFKEGCLIRDEETGLVCGLKDELWEAAA